MQQQSGPPALHGGRFLPLLRVGTISGRVDCHETDEDLCCQVELRGKLPEYSTGKDVIITLCGLFNKDEVLNHAVVRHELSHKETSDNYELFFLMNGNSGICRRGCKYAIHR